MKYCCHCGHQVEDDVKFCPNCGFETEAPTVEDAQKENYYDGIKYEQTAKPVNIGISQGEVITWNILSCLFPLLGFIMAAVWSKSKPELSSVCLRAAIFGLVFDLITGLLNFL